MLGWSFDGMNVNCAIDMIKWLNRACANSESSGLHAQASMSRLGEISSDSPKMSAWVVVQVSNSCFERESISLKQGGLA